MKKLISLFILLCCVSAFANVNVVFVLTDFQLSPTTNQTVWIQAMSVPTVSQSSIVIGPKLITNSGSGTFTNSMAPNLLYAITVKDPTYGSTIGSFMVFPTNVSGTVPATMCLVPPGTSTFPAGSVSWSAASSDLRYAPIATALTNGVLLSGTNVFTGTNTFTFPTVFSNSITFGGVTRTNWPTNSSGSGIQTLNTLSGTNQTFSAGTTGTDFAIVSSGTNHAFNLPTASASARGAVSSADWSTFNGKQDALGFTPVSNTRTVATTSPLTGGGALSGNLTLAIPAATGAANGYLSSNDFTTFSNKISSAFTITTTAPLTGGGAATNNLTLAIPAATSLQNGYLPSADWVTFNAKQTALAAAAPLNLTGSNLTITQAGTSGNGYLSSTDYNTFNGKQPSNVVLTGFAALGTNYYQATNANLTGFGQTTTNFFVQVTNGASTGQSLTNQVVKGTWTAATGASSGYVWTSDSGGAATWQAAAGGGTGIPTLNGAGTNTTLTNALLKVSIASNVFTVSKPNVGQFSAPGLVISNSTPSHFSPTTNQASPAIDFVGSAIDDNTSTSSQNHFYLYNQPVEALGTYPQLVFKGDSGIIATLDSTSGLVMGIDNDEGIELKGSAPLKMDVFSGSGNQMAFFDNFGVFSSGATTDMLPQGSTNLWYSNGLVQSFGDVRYQRKGVKTVTTTYTVTTNDYEIDADTTAGGFTVTLPLASFSTNVYVIKNLFTNNLTVSTGGSDHIDNLVSYVNNTLYKADALHSDGVSVYRPIATYNPAGGILTLNGFGTNTTIKTLSVISNLYLSGTNIINTNTIIGSLGNTIENTTLNSAIVNGTANTITGASDTSAILSGANNTIINSARSVIVAGSLNYISNIASSSIIAGGINNSIGAGAQNSSVFGGNNASIGPSSAGSTIVGSQASSIGSAVNYGAVLGGNNSSIGNNASFSTVIGGYSNSVSSGAAYSIASGSAANAAHANTYVWNDTLTNFASTGPNQYLIHSLKGFGINTNNPSTNGLLVAGSIAISNGFGTFTGNGLQLTNLNATNLIGTIAASQITNSSFAATLAPIFSAANLTSIPAGTNSVNVLTNDPRGFTNTGVVSMTNTNSVFSYRATHGQATSNNGAYFSDFANNVVADSSTFPTPSFPGQFITLYSATIGGDTAGQEFIANSSTGWCRDRQFGRVTIFGTNGVNGEVLLVKGTNGQDNIISVQNQASNHYSAIRYIDMVGNEVSALGYGNSNAAFYANNNYWEDLGNIKGAYFASTGHLNGGLERGTQAFVWYDGASGTNDASANKVFQVTKTGVVSTTNSMRALAELNAGTNGGTGVFRVNNFQWNPTDDLQHFDGSMMSRVHQAFATNFNATQTGAGTIAFSTSSSHGWGQDSSKLTGYNTGVLTVDHDNNGDGTYTWRDRVNTDHFPFTTGWGSMGDATHFFGYAYFKTNICNTLIVGNATNTASFTLVNTNWVSGFVYTNNTGRTIMVSGNAVLTTAGVAGYSQMGLAVPGVITNYASVLSAIGGLTGAMTNAITPAFIINGGTFTFTNTSSGAGDTSTTWGGQYMTY